MTHSFPTRRSSYRSSPDGAVVTERTGRSAVVAGSGFGTCGRERTSLTVTAGMPALLTSSSMWLGYETAEVVAFFPKRSRRLEQKFVDVAPSPRLAGFGGPHQRVARCVEVCRGVPARRVVGAAAAASS